MKVLAITSIRSDYDLMSGLFRAMHRDPYFDLGLLVCGAHLSKTLGQSMAQIVDDGIPVVARVESLLDADSHSARLKSAAIMLMGCIDAVRDHSPDLIVFAGDREEVIAGGLLGGYLNIPTAHFFAGDHTQDGHIDNPVRHATSKLASFFFASTNEHRDRLIAIGEEPERIATVGSVALDRFVTEPRAPIDEAMARHHIDCGPGEYALVIFHPIRQELARAAEILDAIIDALAANGLKALVGAPNTDPGHGYFDALRERHGGDGRAVFYDVLPREDFLALFGNARIIVGNSSAGILEAATLKLPCVNVGLRQRGRFAGRNVLFVDADRSSIEQGVGRAASDAFRDGLSDLVNPYGSGDSIQRAIDVLKATNFAGLQLKQSDPLDTRRTQDKTC